MIKLSPNEQHLAKVGRKNPLLTGRDLQQYQAHGGLNMCCDLLDGEGERKE